MVVRIRWVIGHYGRSCFDRCCGRRRRVVVVVVVVVGGGEVEWKMKY